MGSKGTSEIFLTRNGDLKRPPWITTNSTDSRTPHPNWHARNEMAFAAQLLVEAPYLAVGLPCQRCGEITGGVMSNIGALVIRIRFWGILCG